MSIGIWTNDGVFWPWWLIVLAAAPFLFYAGIFTHAVVGSIRSSEHTIWDVVSYALAFFFACVIYSHIQ